MNEFEMPKGAQVVSRISALLRRVSQSMPEGIGTTQIAQDTQISRPTAHRLLASLASQGFVDRDPATGGWLLGPEIYLMGHVAADRYDISHLARDHVVALAEATGESAFLSVRRGNETVCLTRVDGDFPIRSFVLYEGKRFPLGIASAGLAILSFMAPHAIERYLTQNDFTGSHGPSHSPSAIRERIARTREHGYATNPALIVEGSWGLGAAVFGPSNQPDWALSLTGIEPRFNAARRAELGQLLLRHAHQLSLQFN